MMNYLQKKKKAMLNYVSGITPPPLPSEYQEVEWIGSSGTQYIDTDYIPNANTKWELESQVNSITWNSGIGNGCIKAPYNDNCFSVGHNSNSTLFMFMGVRDTSSTIPYDANKHLFVLDAPNREKKIDDTIFSSTGTNFDGNLSIYLFSIHYTSGVGGRGKFNIYSCKFFESDVLVGNFVPCYRKADNEIGMYDTVTQTFYTNAGTGTFTKGQDV